MRSLFNRHTYVYHLIIHNGLDIFEKILCIRATLSMFCLNASSNNLKAPPPPPIQMDTKQLFSMRRGVGAMVLGSNFQPLYKYKFKVSLTQILKRYLKRSTFKLGQRCMISSMDLSYIFSVHCLQVHQCTRGSEIEPSSRTRMQVLWTSSKTEQFFGISICHRGFCQRLYMNLKKQC